MPIHLVYRITEHTGRPNAFQEYNVPYPQNDHYKRHDESVYSMWMHFVTFCSVLQKTGNNSVSFDSLLEQQNVGNTNMNFFTRKKRLDVFLGLSKGCPTEEAQKEASVYESIYLVVHIMFNHTIVHLGY